MALAAPELFRPLERETPKIQQLDEFLGRRFRRAARLVGPGGEEIDLPESVYALLRSIVHQLASGATVAVIPYDTMLTTQQAADVLDVSRPYLVKLLEDQRAIPYKLVGTHRRVAFKDLLAYRDRSSADRKDLLTKMVRDAESSGLYAAEAEHEAKASRRR